MISMNWSILRKWGGGLLFYVTRLFVGFRTIIIMSLYTFCTYYCRLCSEFCGDNINLVLIQ